jgi:hypothetical protein
VIASHAFQKLREIHIRTNFHISESHKIEPQITHPPNKAEKQKLSALGVKLAEKNLLLLKIKRSVKTGSISKRLCIM